MNDNHRFISFLWDNVHWLWVLLQNGRSERLRLSPWWNKASYRSGRMRLGTPRRGWRLLQCIRPIVMMAIVGQAVMLSHLVKYLQSGFLNSGLLCREPDD